MAKNILIDLTGKLKEDDDVKSLIKKVISTDTYTEGGYQIAEVTNAVEYTIPFGGVTNAKAVIIVSAIAGTIKVNSNTDSQPHNNITVLTGNATQTLTGVKFTPAASGAIEYFVAG